MIKKQLSKLSIIQDDIEQIYNIIEQLGSGAFGSIYKVQQKGSKQQKIYAMKRMSIDPLSQECKEIEKMKNVRNDNIVEFYRYSLMSNEANLIMKLCKGSLRDLMNNWKKQFDERRIIDLMVQITNGMLELDRHNIMHLDLKPQNILFENGNYFKICDFGCIKNAQYNTYIVPQMREQSPVKFSTKNFGTPMYVAPEIILDRKIMHKNSCDIWSLAVIIYEIVCHKFPFPINTNSRIYQQSAVKDFCDGKRQISFSQIPYQKLIGLLKKMMHHKSLQRPSWKKLKQYLITTYHRQQSQFCKIRDVFENTKTMSIILFNILDLIQKSQQNNKHPFWQKNTKQLKQISYLICQCNYNLFLKIKHKFSFKLTQKLPIQSQQQLQFFIQNCTTQLNKFLLNPQDQIYIQQKKWDDELITQLAQLLSIMKKGDSQWESIGLLKCFIDEAMVIGGFFNQGNKFVDTLKKMEIDINS